MTTLNMEKQRHTYTIRLEHGRLENTTKTLAPPAFSFSVSHGDDDNHFQLCCARARKSRFRTAATQRIRSWDTAAVSTLSVSEKDFTAEYEASLLYHHVKPLEHMYLPPSQRALDVNLKRMKQRPELLYTLLTTLLSNYPYQDYLRLAQGLRTDDLRDQTWDMKMPKLILPSPLAASCILNVSKNDLDHGMQKQKRPLTQPVVAGNPFESQPALLPDVISFSAPAFEEYSNGFKNPSVETPLELR